MLMTLPQRLLLVACRLLCGGLLMLLCGGLPVAKAQTADSVITRVSALALFEEARALGVDRVGRLYVVDGFHATLSQFSPAGLLLNTWGGPGQGDYEFDDPMDVDPSEGLVIWMADAGNGAVKRYSSEFLHLETLSLSDARAGQTAGNTGFRTREGNPEATLVGRPLAVAQTISEEVFVLDAERNAVVKWDADRRVERIFGSYNDGSGALDEPVALDVGPDGRVFVADAGHQAVLVYDRFGQFLHRLADGLAVDVTGLAVHRERLLVVLPTRILVYQMRGRLAFTYAVDLGEPLVDVAVANQQLYLLTATHLYQTKP